MATRNGRTIEEIVSALPGYLSLERRPKCRMCGKTLRLAPMDRTEKSGNRLFVTPIAESAVCVHYGYDGDNLFCTIRCGYRYGLYHAQKKA